jgi:hypothetical protein
MSATLLRLLISCLTHSSPLPPPTVFLLHLIFDLEDRGIAFLRNVEVPLEYAVLQTIIIIINGKIAPF